MRGKQYDIFISYRRSDGTHTARLFKSEFERRGYRTFLDFDDLTDGKFDKRIENAILDAPVFVMILTNDYFARCNEEDDWVRKEIYCAIENERVIIPVNYDGNLNGIPDYLEPKLKREIGLHQFSTVYADAAFQVTFDKMIKDRVEKVIKIMSDNDPQPQPQPRPKPKPVQTDSNEQNNNYKDGIIGIIGTVVILGILLLFIFFLVKGCEDSGEIIDKEKSVTEITTEEIPIQEVKDETSLLEIYSIKIGLDDNFEERIVAPVYKVSALINYKSLANHEYEFDLKWIKPDGTVLIPDEEFSHSGYSYTIAQHLSYGTGTMEFTLSDREQEGWWETGEYAIEIWCNGILLKRKEFRIY